MKENILIEKSVDFGARIVRLNRYLVNWLHILQKSDYLDENMATSILNDCLEIKRILIASINTAKEN